VNQQKTTRCPIGTRPANTKIMSEPRSLFSANTRSVARRPSTTFVSLAAAKAGRETVWVLIAAAFCVVELLVFVTEFPMAKRWQRREAAKSARHSA
jgi:hypothetical protein